MLHNPHALERLLYCRCCQQRTAAPHPISIVGGREWPTTRLKQTAPRPSQKDLEHSFMHPTGSTRHDVRTKRSSLSPRSRVDHLAQISARVFRAHIISSPPPVLLRLRRDARRANRLRIAWNHTPQPRHHQLTWQIRVCSSPSGTEEKRS